MTLIKKRDVLQEILIYLRNNLTDPKSRGTDTIESFTAAVGQTEFTLTNQALNIKTVEKDSVALSFGSEYTVDYENKKVTLIVACTGGESIAITNHHSGTWVHDKFPKKDLSVGSYPRICIMDLAASDAFAGIGMEGLDTNFNFIIGLFYESKKDLQEMMDTIKQLLWTNRKSFYYFNGLAPTGSAGPGLDPTRKGKIYGADMDYIIPLQVQT